MKQNNVTLRGERMNLISKKDLLAITGISYGQLYRWKRERLIPEEWFIKQSAYTGQETFFPREQILSRIKSILELKDSYSLEELAKMLSPQTSTAKVFINDLWEMEEVEKELINLLPGIYNKEHFDFNELAFIIAISQAKGKLGLTRDECESLLRRGISAASKLNSTDVSCTILYVENRYHMVFSPNAVTLSFDDEIEVKEQLHLSEIADSIRIKYKNRFFK
jgi:DNA-binding transcriptional MerR regulator